MSFSWLTDWQWQRCRWTGNANTQVYTSFIKLAEMNSINLSKKCKAGPAPTPLVTDPFDDNSEAAHGRLLLKCIRTIATADRVSRSDR